MRKLTAGVIIVTAALALSFVAISLFGTSQANTDESAEALGKQTSLAIDEPQGAAPESTIAKGNAQAAEGEDAQTRPYIGIVIEGLPDEKTEALGINSGVYIRRVFEDCPADGSLFKGDIITAVAGESVSTASDLIEIVQASEAGDTLTFSVLRDDESIEVDVTVGEREIVIINRTITGPLIDGGLMQAFSGGFDSFVRGEAVMETDGEFKTIRAVSGTVEEGTVNETAGTFRLVPRDGATDVDESQLERQSLENLGGRLERIHIRVGTHDM